MFGGDRLREGHTRGDLISKDEYKGRIRNGEKGS